MNATGDSSENISASPTSTSSTCSDSDTYAEAPFNDNRGDIILQSSDNVKFRVFKLILELSSPVFRDMLSLPQPIAEGPSEQVPIVPVSESSAALGPLLEFCYPATRPQLSQYNITQLEEVLRAVIKYDISIASEPICEAFRERAVLCERDALEVYAIACNLKLEKEVHAAATACLKWPVLGISVPHMASISGLDLFNLLDFHRRAGKAVVWLISESHFKKMCCEALPNEYCYSCKGIRYEVWAEFRSKLVDALVDAPLDASRIALSTVVLKLEQKMCSSCKERMLQSWERTKEAIISSINAQVSKVELMFSWK